MWIGREKRFTGVPYNRILNLIVENIAYYLTTEKSRKIAEAKERDRKLKILTNKGNKYH